MEKLDVVTGVTQIRERVAKGAGRPLRKHDPEADLHLFCDFDDYQATAYSPTAVRSLHLHAYAAGERVRLGIGPTPAEVAYIQERDAR